MGKHALIGVAENGIDDLSVYTGCTHPGGETVPGKVPGQTANEKTLRGQTGTADAMPVKRRPLSDERRLVLLPSTIPRRGLGQSIVQGQM